MENGPAQSVLRKVEQEPTPEDRIEYLMREMRQFLPSDNDPPDRPHGKFDTALELYTQLQRAVGAAAITSDSVCREGRYTGHGDLLGRVPREAVKTAQAVVLFAMDLQARTDFPKWESPSYAYAHIRDLELLHQGLFFRTYDVD
jgi:hypothetical protein